MDGEALQQSDQASQHEEGINLPEGLSAVMFPEFVDSRGSPMAPEVVQDQLNAFLEGLNQSGADIVNTISIPVRRPPLHANGMSRDVDATFIIVRRSPQAN